MERQLNVINIQALVHHLDRVHGFIQNADIAVRAAGYQFTKEQIEIQQLGYDITKLCDKSLQTVAKFMEVSSNIINDLQYIYGYFLDDMEGMAIDKVFSVSKRAGEIVNTALDLHHNFMTQEKR